MLFDLDYNKSASTTPRVVAAACEVRDPRPAPHQLTFTATGIADTKAVVRIQSRLKPTNVSIAGQTLAPDDYEVDDGTILLHFPNSVDPVSIEVSF